MSRTRRRPSVEAICGAIDSRVDAREHVRLIDIAADLDVSPRTVQRALKDEGATFFDTLNESRIYVAAHALVICGASVSRAGQAAGFATTSDFCAAFKAFVGVTPGAFRAAGVHRIWSDGAKPRNPEKVHAKPIAARLSTAEHFEALEAITSSMTRQGLDMFEDL